MRRPEEDAAAAGDVATTVSARKAAFDGFCNVETASLSSVAWWIRWMRVLALLWGQKQD